jgi:hypothetical protein
MGDRSAREVELVDIFCIPVADRIYDQWRRQRRFSCEDVVGEASHLHARAIDRHGLRFGMLSQRPVGADEIS